MTPGLDPTRRAARRATAIGTIATMSTIAALAATARAAAGQPLAERVRGVGDGVVRFRYAVRPGVCGDGGRGIEIRAADGTTRQLGEWRGGTAGGRPCDPGPARMTLTVRDGVARAITLAVGGSRAGDAGGPARDLGPVAAPAAAAYLLALAARDDAPSPGRVLVGAVVADSSVVWPALLRLARDDRLPDGTRREATFWAGRAACDAEHARRAHPASADTTDRDVRAQVVFALSQRPDDERRATLARVARTDRDPAVRCAALFWLGQGSRAWRAESGVLALYEASLRGGPPDDGGRTGASPPD